MKKKLSLIKLAGLEMEKRNQASIRAGLDPNPDGEDEKCTCLCAPGSDKGWRQEYEKQNGHPPT